VTSHGGLRQYITGGLTLDAIAVVEALHWLNGDLLVGLERV